MLRALAVEQAEDREVRDALARAGLADDAERLAAAEREREAGDGVDDAVRRREVDREVADVEEQLGCSRVAHARVEEGVHDVDHEVHDHDRERRRSSTTPSSPGRSCGRRSRWP